MQAWRDILRRSVLSGSLASALSTIALALCGKAECGAPYAPTNAISHWIWAGRAFRQNRSSMRYTLIGYGIHHASSVFWATVHERLFGGRNKKPLADVLIHSAAITGLACFVDYKVTPKRFQPGFEERLSTRSVFLVYAAFALGLALHDMSRNRADRQSPTNRHRE